MPTQTDDRPPGSPRQVEGWVHDRPYKVSFALDENGRRFVASLIQDGEDLIELSNAQRKKRAAEHRKRESRKRRRSSSFEDDLLAEDAEMKSPEQVLEELGIKK